MIRLSSLIVGVTALFFAAANAFAGAWPQPEGMGYYKIGSQLVSAEAFYEPNGEKTDIRTIGDYTFSFYGEYGITERWTAVAYVPFKRLTINELVGRPSNSLIFPGVSNNGLSDIDLGVRYALRNHGSTAISAAITFGLPIGDDTQEDGLLTGDGEFNQYLALSIGHSLYPLPLYVQGEVGFNHRTENFSDELRIIVEAGYTIGPVLAIARTRILNSLNNGANPSNGGMGGLFSNGQEYVALGLEAALELTQSVGVSLGWETAMNGKNVLSAPAFSIGAYIKM